MKVKNIMTTPVYVIASDEPISRARNLMLKHGISRLVVTQNNSKEEDPSKMAEMIPVGVVTKTDISHKLDQAEPKWRRRPIDNIPINVVMTADPITIYPEATIKQAAELLLENDINGLPVIKSESEPQVIGILTKLDLIRYYSTLPIDSTVEEIKDSTVITVHRHHTISHVIHEMKSNEVDRVIVVDDVNVPVGIITKTNLTMSKMINPRGGLPDKDIKMARKNRTGGEKIFRYIKEVSLVAEDIMSQPLITLHEHSKSVEAARIMSEERINGIPIVNDKITGIVNARNIIKKIVEL